MGPRGRCNRDIDYAMKSHFASGGITTSWIVHRLQ